MPARFTHIFPLLIGSLLLTTCSPSPPESTTWKSKFLSEGNVNLRSINGRSLTSAIRPQAIIHSTIITGDGATVIDDGMVLISNGIIQAVGKSGEIEIPAGAETIDAAGMTLLPGLIDAHFHLDQLDSLPTVFLSRGITSLRDPGAWIEAYEGEIDSGRPLPRLFLTGPHFDMYPAAYPKNSILLRGPEEAERAVHRFADQGASAIKIYFKSSLSIIRATCSAAHERGMPVTAHLEITDIYDAVSVGLDGIEHITSFGYNLIPPREAEAYKQAILRDNNARRLGRYNMWQDIDPQGEKARALAEFIGRNHTFVCPTLGAFEYQPAEGIVDSLRLEGFTNMKKYTSLLHQAGVPVVVGSHSWVRYAEYGWAYHHEMELLEELGMTPLAIIRAATLDNARFFGIAERLGTVETGKAADLLLIRGDQLDSISQLRNVERVMLAGNWVLP